MWWWHARRRAVSAAHILPVLTPTPAAMAPKLARPMAAANPKKGRGMWRGVKLRGFYLWGWLLGVPLENLIICSPFTFIALAGFLSVCCMSQQLEIAFSSCAGRLGPFHLLITQSGGKDVLKEVVLHLRCAKNTTRATSTNPTWSAWSDDANDAAWVVGSCTWHSGQCLITPLETNRIELDICITKQAIQSTT